ncbi:unnamed protein product, partial [Prunus brigantina]
ISLVPHPICQFQYLHTQKAHNRSKPFKNNRKVKFLIIRHKWLYYKCITASHLKLFPNSHKTHQPKHQQIQSLTLGFAKKKD